MNTPVSFPIAKLLKEKGFYEPCLKCYLEDGSVQISSGDEGDFDNYNHNQWDNYSAPTIAEVVMWLYKNHGIWISVGVVPFEKYYTFECTISKFDGHIHQEGVFVTPTGAFKAAIQYTLNNLI